MKHKLTTGQSGILITLSSNPKRQLVERWTVRPAGKKVTHWRLKTPGMVGDFVHKGTARSLLARGYLKPNGFAGLGDFTISKTGIEALNEKS